MTNATDDMAAGSGVLDHYAGRPASRPGVPAGDHILTFRITAPDAPDWAVPRPRVTKLIIQSTRWCPLTVVTGPAGAGKTMALALWSAAEPGPIGWVGLDEFDDRPGAFWSYVVAALRRSGVIVPEGLPAIAPRPVANHVFLLHLASALAAQDPPVTLVIDDLHLLTDPGVLKELDFVLRNAGPGLRLVACSRTDPLLPLHRSVFVGGAFGSSRILAGQTAPEGRQRTGHLVVIARNVTTTVVVTAMLGVLLLCLARVGRWVLDRRRLAAWGAAWAAVGPLWTKRFRSRG